MLFLYFVIAVALFFYIRFFILNSLITKAARKATLSAAVKAVYFIPLFLQGLFLLWIGVVHFFVVCKGFLLLFNQWVYNSNNDDVYDFLYRISYIGIGSLLLSLHFILGKTSLNKKMDALNIFFKAAYATAAYLMLKVLMVNAVLLHPIAPIKTGMFLYNSAGFILSALCIYFFVLAFSLFYKSRQQVYRYIQLGAFISGSYIFICVLVAAVLFLLNTICKVIG